MADEDVTIKFGASIEELKAKLTEAVKAIQGVSGGAEKELGQKAVASFGKFGETASKVFDAINKEADKIPAAMRSVGVAVAGALAVVGAGIAAKKFADANAQMIESTRDFARAMGSTTNEASVMQAALDDVGASQNEYLAAAKGLARQLRTNEDDLKRMGLATRDASGNLRPLNDLMLDSIKIVNAHKGGMDQAIASQTLFGRSVDGSSRLLLLNQEAIDENRAAVKELGLEVGLAATDAYKEYDAASDRASLTMKAFGKAIAESVLPFVTQLTEWFNSIGPKAITVIRGALGGLTTAFLGLVNGVQVLWVAIKAMIASVSEPLLALGRAIGSVLSGEGLEAAGQHFRNIPKNVKDSWESALDDMVASSEKAKARIAGVWAFATGGNDAPGQSGASGGTKTATTKGAGNPGLAAAQLALQRAMAEAALKLELEFLKQQEEIDEEAYKQGLISTKEYYDRKLEIERRALDISIAAKRAEQQAAVDAQKKAQELASGGDAKERARAAADILKFEAAQVKLAGEIAVLELQRESAVRRIGDAYADVTRKVDADLAAIRIARAQDTANGEVEAERNALEHLKSMRQISAEDAFQIERQIEEKRYAAAVTAIEARMQLIQGSQDEQRKQQEQLNADLEKLQQDHQRRLTLIDQQAERERAALSIQARESVQNGFATMLTSLMEGQRRVGDVLRNFALTVARTFENLIAQRFAERLFGAGTAGGNLIDTLTKPILDAIGQILVAWGLAEIQQTTMTEGQTAIRSGTRLAAVAAETEASILGAAATMYAQKTATVSSVFGWASAAAAAAMASVAAIPVVGWAMAPGVGAATYANALGYLATAEGGWASVPQDGALAELHKREMVLPRFLAEGMRQMAEPGQLQAVVAGAMQQYQQRPVRQGDSYKIEIHAIDAPGVKRLFEEHGNALLSSLKKQRRDFGF